MKQKQSASHSKFRDFLYNTSDVWVTAVILVIALVIIGWRVNVIMAYPKHMTSGNVKTTAEVKKDAQKNKSTSDQAKNSAQGSKSSAAESSDADKKSSKSDTKVMAEYKDGRLVKTIKIKIETGSLNYAMEQLKTYGLYDSAHEFKVYCHQQGRKAGSIKAGTHTFKKGWTKAKIARALTN